MKEAYILGIDTSNYKTSVAIVSCSGEIVCNIQEYLEVKKGERGLRQSDALFQHINKLPELIERAFQILGNRKISAVSVSSRPRSVDGSYMPVFNAGLSAGRIISSALSVPMFTNSHQEGHVEAVKHGSSLEDSRELVSFHFSGGTTEALLVKNDSVTLAGGTKDLAMGQVLDRLGVTLGMSFPCGAEMDQVTEETARPEKNILTRIKIKDCYFNLSGIETQAQRAAGTVPEEDLIYMIFERLAEAVAGLCRELKRKYGVNDFLFAGGVSSSCFMRKYLKENLKEFNLCFGDPALSTDNAVGTALLGGKKLWQLNQ